MLSGNISLELPEGNWRVTLTLGDANAPSDTTVKAEARRLMLESVKTRVGEFVTRAFTVNLRSPHLPSGDTVRLKPREIGPPLHPVWDNRLTLEFLGPRPRVANMEITRADDAITLYIVGDSTVTDQQGAPYCGWGQMLPRFFGPGVAVANHAESGESLRSSTQAKRLAKVYSRLKPGDLVFVQFGHNDQKEKGPGIGAFTSYTEDLKRVVADVRQRGGVPVLITSMYRRRFDAQGQLFNTLGDYPEAVRQAAKEEGVLLIDLHAMSGQLFRALGPERSKVAFLHVGNIRDDTHFSAYGAYELARCMVEGIRGSRLAIARHLSPDVVAFDPRRPDPVEEIRIPESGMVRPAKPEGS